MTPTKAELRKALKEARQVAKTTEAVVASLKPQYDEAVARAEAARGVVIDAERLVECRDDLDAARALSEAARALLFDLSDKARAYRVGETDARDELAAARLISKGGEDRLFLTTKGKRYALALLTWGVE